MKSSFESDLRKEQSLHPLLDSYYGQLKNYNYKRINDLNQQKQGIDLVFTHNQNGKTFFVDEKAQLDYINESLPTFAFEIQYKLNDSLRNGWLFDTDKKTDFYALVTSIYADHANEPTSCKLTFVNRKKLILELKTRGITKEQLVSNKTQNQNGKILIEQLHPKKEGYLFLTTHKVETPLNLILKLDWLIEKKIAKNFP